MPRLLTASLSVVSVVNIRGYTDIISVDGCIELQYMLLRALINVIGSVWCRCVFKSLILWHAAL